MFETETVNGRAIGEGQVSETETIGQVSETETILRLGCTSKVLFSLAVSFYIPCLDSAYS